MKPLSKSLVLLLLGFGLGQSAFAVTLTTSSVPPEFAKRHYFDQAKEFPNYFLPERYRGLPMDQVPPEVVQETRTALEAALSSLHQKMDWAVFLPGKPDIQSVKLLPLLMSEAHQVDPTAKLYTSGGILRSMLSYLYREMDHAAKTQKPGTPFDGLKFLKDFAKDTHPISDGAVRGVGSDLDLLVDHSQKAEEVKSAVIKLINHGLEAYSGEGSQIADERLGFVRTVFLQGDVKDYAPQIARSSAEGGSTLDWLAFDLQTGKFREPARDPQVIDRFIRGSFNYLAPTEKISAQEHAGTVLRGIRPMLELPHLRVHGQEVFDQEVREQAQWMQKTGGAPTSNDLLQIKKMSRNAILGGAQNRFYRTRPGTLDADLKGWLDQINKKTQARIPVLAYQEQIAGRVIPLGHELPARAFISIDQFIERYTKDGNLYHGTKTVEGMLSILRGGFHTSMDGVQGLAANGSGVYATSNITLAKSYAEKDGKLLTLKVRRDPGLRILNWESAKSLPEFVQIERWCKEHQVDLNEYLAREYHIDAIVNTHVIIQNSQFFDLDHADQLFASMRAEFAEGQKKFVESIDAQIASKNFDSADLIQEIDKSPYKPAIKPSWTEALIEKNPSERWLASHLQLVVERGGGDPESLIAKWLKRIQMDQAASPETLLNFLFSTDRDLTRYFTFDELTALAGRIPFNWNRPKVDYRQAYCLRNPKMVENLDLEALKKDWYTKTPSFESFKAALLRAEKLGVPKQTLVNALLHIAEDGLSFNFRGPRPKAGVIIYQDPELQAVIERTLLSGELKPSQYDRLLRKIPPAEFPSLYRKLAKDPNNWNDLLSVFWMYEKKPPSDLYREIFDQMMAAKDLRVARRLFTMNTQVIELYPQGVVQSLMVLEELDPHFNLVVQLEASTLATIPEVRAFVPSGPITFENLSRAIRAKRSLAKHALSSEPQRPVEANRAPPGGSGLCVGVFGKLQ